MSRQTSVTVRYAALRCARLGVSKTWTWTTDSNRNHRGTRRSGVILPAAYRKLGY
jgi:hypothetical protein